MIEFPGETPLAVAREADGEPPIRRNTPDARDADTSFETVLTNGAQATAEPHIAERMPDKDRLIEFVPPDVIDGMPESLIEELALGLTSDSIALSDLEIKAVAEHVLDVVDSAAVSQLVLMSKFATGRLAYESRAVEPPIAGRTAQPAAQAPHVPAMAPSVNQPVDTGPRVSVWQSKTFTVGAIRGFSAEFDRQMTRMSEITPRYERLVNAAVPPREHLLVIADNGTKRIYIRNFFSPNEAIERFRSMARSSPFDLSGASVYVNGLQAGRV